MSKTPATAAIASVGQRQVRGCFSYAAYAKSLIRHLRDVCHVPVVDGLSDAEFAYLETSLGFTFPPDLRCILREGLPAGPGFPNWRAASLPHLRLLLSLPSLTVSRQISRSEMWSDAWGPLPSSGVKADLSDAPTLVPVYRHCYAVSGAAAGNPVFLVPVIGGGGGGVEMCGIDIFGFFEAMAAMGVPAWAAKEPRRVEFWTDLAERGRRVGLSRGWWCVGKDVGVSLEEAFWRLRDGGWGEAEVREMMGVGGEDGEDRGGCEDGGWRCVACHVRWLSGKLLSAGWSAGEVADTLGFEAEALLPRG